MHWICTKCRRITDTKEEHDALCNYEPFIMEEERDGEGYV